jgi:hypothetical protein
VYLSLFKNSAVQLVVKMLSFAQINSTNFSRPVLPLNVDLHLVYYVSDFDFVLQPGIKKIVKAIQYAVKIWHTFGRIHCYVGRIPSTT